MLFILSCNVLSGYFTQFDGNSHCFNFDIIHDTAPSSSIYPVGVTSPVYGVIGHSRREDKRPVYWLRETGLVLCPVALWDCSGE